MSVFTHPRIWLTAAVLAAICTGWAGTARATDAAAPSPEKLERITEFFNNEIATGKLPGAIVLIQQHGRRST